MPPDNSKETLKDILEDFHKPRTTIIQRHDGKRISICDGVVTILNGSEVTKVDTEKATEIDTGKNTPETTFTDSELEIIERLRNEK